MKYALLALLFFSFSLAAAIQPNGKIVFQPQFLWANGATSYQGTGSFIRTEDNEVVALTSAHFINFSGPKLLQVRWLDIQTRAPVTTSLKNFGQPGREGNYKTLNLRSDYFLLTIQREVDEKSILELDQRSAPEVGERIWFPNKNSKMPLGYHLEEGKVIEARMGYIKIKLDRINSLQSRSGTPILSQKTGKVIGILSGSKKDSLLYLAPASSIQEALKKAHEFPELREVVGY